LWSIKRGDQPQIDSDMDSSETTTRSSMLTVPLSRTAPMVGPSERRKSPTVRDFLIHEIVQSLDEIRKPNPALTIINSETSFLAGRFFAPWRTHLWHGVCLST
jgi:hypothetical protein